MEFKAVELAEAVPGSNPEITVPVLDQGVNKVYLTFNAIILELVGLSAGRREEKKEATGSVDEK
jgi:hypothetical protein